MTKERYSDAKSHRAGRAVMANGMVTNAYRAVAVIVCAQCAGAIGPGALFSRQSRRAPPGMFGLRATDPICVTCRPLRLDDADEDL